MTRSMSQATAASTLREPIAEATPTRAAITALTSEATTPTVMLTDKPLTVRASRSRPSQSVPNR